MLKKSGVLAAALLLCPPVASLVFAWWPAPRTVTSYYYVPVYPVITYPCPPAIVPAVPVIRPVPAQPNYAPPTPAPPSTGPAQPPGRMPAAVSESRSLYGVPAAMPRVVETPAASQSNVSFWNLSGRDVTLNVEARSYFLPQGQSLKLAL